MTDPTILAWLGAGHAVLGALAVLAVYRTMEIRYGAGILLAGALAIGVPLMEFYVGDWLFDPTLAGAKQMIVVVVMSGIIGVMISVWLFQPDLGPSLQESIREIEQDTDMNELAELENLID